MSSQKERSVSQTIDAWLKRVAHPPSLDALQEIKTALYMYRNNQLVEGQIAKSLTAQDDEVMAAVEHYFFARSEVASGEYSENNMRVMIISYQLAKKMKLDMRHNANKPATPPSELQKRWALLGAAHGEKDRVRENAFRRKRNQSTIEPPLFRLPPNFTGSYQNARLDKFRY